MARFASDLTAHMRLFELIRQEQVAGAPRSDAKAAKEAAENASNFQSMALKSFR